MRLDVERGLVLTDKLEIGFVLLAHHHLHRCGQLAFALAEQGFRVAVHVDRKCAQEEFSQLEAAVGRNSNILLTTRVACTWGKFSLVEATLLACRELLTRWPQLDHVCHLSGDTLPLRPLAAFTEFLQAKSGVDFIESVLIADDWITGGLGIERFQFWFPFAWRTQRRRFDLLVKIQRWLGIRRRIPHGLEPRVGSQFWCLRASTLKAILGDPERATYDRYFKWTWIPDESYFQTLVHKYSTSVESHPIVLSNFDASGSPYVFYDDHEEILAKSGAFFARKIWHDAARFYERFLDENLVAAPVDRTLYDIALKVAAMPKSLGRAGLTMQSRFPTRDKDNSETPCGYDVFCGFESIGDFVGKLRAKSEQRIHGRLFGANKPEFYNGADVLEGCLPANAQIRDANPIQYLRNLLWSCREERQGFMFAPEDAEKVGMFLLADANCRLFVLGQSGEKAAGNAFSIGDEFKASLRNTANKAEIIFVDPIEFGENPVRAFQRYLAPRTSKTFEKPQQVGGATTANQPETDNHNRVGLMERDAAFSIGVPR